MNIIPLPAPGPDMPAEIARQARRLEEMIEAGMEMMRMVLQQAQAQASVQAEPGGAAKAGRPRDFTVAFHRITTGIRQAMAMANKLKQEPVAAKAPATKATALGKHIVDQARDPGVSPDSNPPTDRKPGIRVENPARPVDPLVFDHREKTTRATLAQSVALPVIPKLDRQEISVSDPGLTPGRHPG